MDGRSTANLNLRRRISSVSNRFEPQMKEVLFILHMFRRSPLSIFGAAIVIVLILMGVFAPFVAPYDPIKINLEERLAPPSPEHFFGTDELGRDILTRTIFGSRISIMVGITAVAAAVSVGLIIGLISGYLGGKVDEVLMRVMDIILSFPSLILAMLLAAALGPSLSHAMMAIALVMVPVYARLARGQTLRVREELYIEAARSVGSSDKRIVFLHILPNIFPPILVQGTLDVAYAILTEAYLSFIGLGAQPPTPEWGAIASIGRQFLMNQPWYPILPGIAIAITVMGFNLFGDGLRDALDPRLRR